MDLKKRDRGKKKGTGEQAFNCINHHCCILGFAGFHVTHVPSHLTTKTEPTGHDNVFSDNLQRGVTAESSTRNIEKHFLCWMNLLSCCIVAENVSST